RLENTSDERIEVLREHDTVAAAFDAQLVSESRPVARTCHVDHRVREKAVSITAGHDRQPEALRDRQYEPVVSPIAVSVQLERMDPIAVGAEKREQRRIVPELTDVDQIPTRMIEHDEGLRAFAEGIEQLSQPGRLARRGTGSVLRERTHHPVDRHG